MMIVHWHGEGFPLVKIYHRSLLLGADRPSRHGKVRHGLSVDHDCHLPSIFGHLLPLLPTASSRVSEFILLLGQEVVLRALLKLHSPL